MDFSFRERILVKGIPHRYFLMLNFQHCGLSWIAGVLYFRGIHFQKPCFKLKLSVGNSTNLVTKGKIILCIQWTHWYRILWTRCHEVNKFHRLTLRWILIGCFMLKIFELFIALMRTRYEGRVKMFTATKQTNLISETCTEYKIGIRWVGDGPHGRI